VTPLIARLWPAFVICETKAVRPAVLLYGPTHRCEPPAAVAGAEPRRIPGHRRRGAADPGSPGSGAFRRGLAIGAYLLYCEVSQGATSTGYASFGYCINAEHIGSNYYQSRCH
jgi:hypothetical protein